MKLNYITNKLGHTGSLVTKTSCIQGITAIVTVLASIGIARFYNSEVLGIYAFTFSLAAYLSTITEFGAKTSLSKLIVANSGIARDILKKSLTFTIPLAIFIGSITILITNSLNLNPSIPFFKLGFITYITCLTIFSVLLSILRGFKCFMGSVIYTFLNRFIFLITITVISFYTKNPVYVVILLSVSLVILFPFIHSKLNSIFPTISSSISYKNFIKTSILFLFITISMFTLYFIDRIIVRYLADFISLGYYSAYYNIANIVRIVSGLLPIIIVPLAVNKKFNIRKSLVALTIIILPISIIIAIASPFIIPFLYGPSFRLNDIYLPWALASSSFLLLLYSYFNSILVGENPTSTTLFRIVIFDAIISLTLPIIFSNLLFPSVSLTAVPMALSITLLIKLVLNFYFISKLRLSSKLISE